MYVFDMTERFKYFYNASSVNTSPSDKRGGTRTVDLVWDVKLVITFTLHLLPLLPLPPLTSVAPITTQTHGNPWYTDRTGKSMRIFKGNVY